MRHNAAGNRVISLFFFYYGYFPAALCLIHAPLSSFSLVQLPEVVQIA